MDTNRFHNSVIKRSRLDIWLVLLSSKDSKGHESAKEIFQEAFLLGKGFIKFAYVDAVKYPHVQRKLQLKTFPQFCVFHSSGYECKSTSFTPRELINYASSFLLDFADIADDDWMFKYEQTPVAVLFTDKPSTPTLWSAIGSSFRHNPIKIGISNNIEFALKYNVTTFPTILFHNFTHNIIYDGANDFSSIRSSIKKFIKRKLQKSLHPTIIHPMTEYNKYCSGDVICILNIKDEIEPEFELIRKKHTTSMLQFFFGSEAPFDYLQKGFIYAVTPNGEKYIKIENVSSLNETVQSILDGNANWTQADDLKNEL
ncbi:Thioredoxin family protein [Histomonas meleagridis]|uniref:Thioredoxin family protein n=1 Tax=Histomonas meleagridis TaxID=135588 RepID=UPI003559B9BA|nr:Thioredoxin family protein [Histomonas meleagridis]KAH0798217.1 Thioredoxin family protein [Histomonas meleagridis]